MRRAILSAVALLSAGVAAGNAVASPWSARVTVRPTVGSPRTRFLVSFTAPLASGRSGPVWRGYELSASGRPARGCEWRAGRSVGSVRAGERVHAELLPPGTAGRWCPGRFAGRVIETITPVCPFREVCPAFVAIETLGRFSFYVRGRRGAHG